MPGPHWLGHRKVCSATGLAWLLWLFLLLLRQTLTVAMLTVFRCYTLGLLSLYADLDSQHPQLTCYYRKLGKAMRSHSPFQALSSVLNRKRCPVCVSPSFLSIVQPCHGGFGQEAWGRGLFFHNGSGPL